MAGLHFPITADNRGFMSAVHEIASGVRSASNTIQMEGGNIDAVISTIKAGVASLGIGWGFKELAQQVSNTRGQFQQLEVAFKTMLGSAEEADKLMGQLVRTAAITPFDLQGVANGAKSLMAYGVQATEVNETLVRLGDIAAGLSIPLNDLVYLYGTTMVQGRMFTQDLRQFQGRGIPIADELAKQFGVAKEKVGELVTAGKVGAEEFKQAIVSMTSEGSQFGGLMEAQSKTISGQISNIEDAVDVMFNEIGKSTEGLINLSLEATSAIVENWQSVLLVLGDIAAAYGAQKAFLALDAGFTKAAVNNGYDAEIEQLTALLPIKEQEEKTTLQQAVASGALSKAKADEVLALREEAAAQLEVLVKNEEMAAKLAQTALDSADAASETVRNIQDQKQSWLELYDEAITLGDAESAQAIATEIAAVEVELKTAADDALTLSEAARSAATEAAAAAEARETLQTNINTAATAGNTAATNILTIAKEKLALAIAKVNALVAANKFSIMAAAAVALGYAIYKLCTYQTDYQKSLQKVNEATTEATVATHKEIKTLDELKAKLAVTQKGSEEWKSTKDAIVKQFGQYIPQLDLEIEKVGNLSTAYHDLVKAIQEANSAKGLKDFLDKNDNTADVISTYREGLDKWRNSHGFMGKTMQAQFEEIFREYAVNSASDQNIFDFTKDRFKAKFGVDKGEMYYNAFEQSLKKSDLTGFTEAHTMNRTREREIEMYRADMGISEDQYKKVRYGIEPVKDDSKNLETAYNEAKKNYEDTKALVAKMEANRKDYTDKAYEEAKTNLKAYKDTFEKLGGVTKEEKGKTTGQKESDREAARQQLLDLLKTQQKERLLLEQQYELERWQTRVNLMDEGEAKVLEAEKLNFAKEKFSLENQKNEAIKAEMSRQKSLHDAKESEKASGNKNYAKVVFDPETMVDATAIREIEARYEELENDLTLTQTKAQNDRLKAAKASMNAFLSEFGNYRQKRRAIEEEYQNKIASAPDKGSRRSAMANRDKALANLDFEQWQEGGGMALAFGDISKLSKETISQLIADMELYRSKIIATFDPEKISAYQSALDKLREAEMSEDGFFSSEDTEYLQTIRTQLALQKQLADEQSNDILLLEEKKRIEEELLAITAKLTAPSTDASIPSILGIKEDGTPIAENTEDSEPKSILSDEDARRADELRVNLESVNKSLEGSQKNSRLLESQLQKTGKLKFADFKKLAANVSNAGKEAAKLASYFSDDIADAISRGVDAFDEMHAAVETITKSIRTLTTTTVEKVVTVVDAAGVAMKTTTTTAAASMSAMEKASAILAIIGAAIQLATMIVSLVNPDKKHEKNIEALQDKVDNLEKAYTRLGRAVDKAYSASASNMISEQNRLLRQQQTLIKMQMEEEKLKKKHDDDRLKEWQDQLDDINVKIEENVAKAKEALTGTTLQSAIDDFASAYVEAWQDCENGADRAMSSVKSIVASALSELTKKNIQPFAESFYNTLSEAMKDGSLTEAELDNLDAIKREMDRAAAKTEGMVKTIEERYGEDRTQGGASASFSGMTQETGDAIAGRLSAVFMSVEAIRSVNAEIAESVAASLEFAKSQKSLMEDALNIHLISMGHLEAISNNTRELATIREDLSKIERHVRNL